MSAALTASPLAACAAGSIEIASVEHLQAQNVLFLDAMEEWLNVIMPTQVRANTLDEYKRAFNYHIKTYKTFVDLPI